MALYHYNNPEALTFTRAHHPHKTRESRVGKNAGHSSLKIY